MAIMVRFAELMARCLWFLWEFVEFLYFLDCPHRILGGITWKLQKEPPISNIKILIRSEEEKILMLREECHLSHTIIKFLALT